MRERLGNDYRSEICVVVMIEYWKVGSYLSMLEM